MLCVPVTYEIEARGRQSLRSLCSAKPVIPSENGPEGMPLMAKFVLLSGEFVA
jgi:hypothetical protein